MVTLASSRPKGGFLRIAAPNPFRSHRLRSKRDQQIFNLTISHRPAKPQEPGRFLRDQRLERHSAGIRLARERQVNVRVIPTGHAIDESIELAHEIFNKVFRRVPAKLK